MRGIMVIPRLRVVGQRACHWDLLHVSLPRQELRCCRLPQENCCSIWCVLDGREPGRPAASGTGSASRRPAWQRLWWRCQRMAWWYAENGQLDAISSTFHWEKALSNPKCRNWPSKLPHPRDPRLALEGLESADAWAQNFEVPSSKMHIPQMPRDRPRGWQGHDDIRRGWVL